MPLETLAPGAPVNIRALTTEPSASRESGYKFDLKREISEEERQTVEEALKLQLADPRNDKASVIGDYLLLYPETRTSLPISRDWIRPWRGDRHFEIPAHQIRAVFPELPLAELLGGTKPEDLEDGVTLAVNQLQTGLPSLENEKRNDLRIAANYKVLFPERFEHLTIPPFVVEQIKDGLESLRRDEGEDIWSYHFPKLARDAAILLGTSQSLELTSLDWYKMRKELATFRMRGAWWTLVEQASDLAIIAADEVTVDETGVHRVYHPKPQFEVPSQPLPEVRRF